MNPAKIIIHSDIFLDYLLHRGKEEHVLRRLLRSSFCYTTVFNAIELFTLARSGREQDAVEDALSAVKILGLNAKNAKKYGGWKLPGATIPRMNMLVAGLCLETRLPLLTGTPDEFRGMKGLAIVLPENIT